MSPGNIARVRGQEGRQRQARQRVLEELAQQVARLLQALEFQGVEAVEHLAVTQWRSCVSSRIQTTRPVERAGADLPM